MQDNENAVVVRQETSGMMSVKQVADRVNAVHEILNKVMKKDTHFGTVPGCGNKMVLLKPGADVLAMTFRLVPQFRVDRTDLPDGHRELDVTCSMFNPSGELLGQGVGSASTMEKKYRWRKDGRGNKIENEDIADMYNTVLKIAKKRAHIDATLTVTGAADLFTQDLIDEDEEQRPPVAMPKEKPQPPKQQTEPTDDTLETTVTLGVVESKSGTGKKGNWTRYYSRADDGEYYSTFSDTIGAKMQELAELGDPVVIEYRLEKTAKGESRTVLSVKGPDEIES
jgi:hypothetical protein